MPLPEPVTKATRPVKLNMASAAGKDEVGVVFMRRILGGDLVPAHRANTHPQPLWAQRKAW